MKVLIAILMLLTTSGLCQADPAKNIKSNGSGNKIELNCNYRSGAGTQFENEVNIITIDIKQQSIRLFATKRDDGWTFDNSKDDVFNFKKTASIVIDNEGNVDGVALTLHVSSAFQYLPSKGKFTWIWLGKDGTSRELVYNCWRIK